MHDVYVFGEDKSEFRVLCKCFIGFALYNHWQNDKSKLLPNRGYFLWGSRGVSTLSHFDQRSGSNRAISESEMENSESPGISTVAPSSPWRARDLWIPVLFYFAMSEQGKPRHLYILIFSG
jgi:hypothetical protein